MVTKRELMQVEAHNLHEHNPGGALNRDQQIDLGITPVEDMQSLLDDGTTRPLTQEEMARRLEEDFDNKQVRRNVSNEPSEEDESDSNHPYVIAERRPWRSNIPTSHEEALGKIGLEDARNGLQIKPEKPQEPWGRLGMPRGH